LTGEQDFMSLSFAVSPAVLVPRPETEHLVEAILDLEEEAGPPRAGAAGRLLADVGTGSGAIAVSLTSYVTTLRAVATDVSTDILAVAKANAERHKVDERIDFRLGGGLAILADCAGHLAYLVSNPPYIPTALIAELDPEVRDWEPRAALDGGPDGLTLIRELIAESPSLLGAGGYLALEVMAGQADAVIALADAAGDWEEIRAIADLAGHDRVVLARRRP
jgi:release factor glutamine methyltransferase